MKGECCTLKFHYQSSDEVRNIGPPYPNIFQKYILNPLYEFYATQYFVETNLRHFHPLEPIVEWNLIMVIFQRELLSSNKAH